MSTASSDATIDATLRCLYRVVDLDEEQLAELRPYLWRLLEIGINFEDSYLQQSIEAYPNRIGSACESVLEYAGYLAHHQRTFENEFHSTRCLTRAFLDDWQSYPYRAVHLKLAPAARYVSPYEQAYTLICQINTGWGRDAISPEILDPLSDEAILAMMPALKQHLLDSKQRSPVPELVPVPPIRVD